MMLVPLAEAANRGGALSEGAMRLFGHPWGGLTVWGLLLPWFVFACGVSVPMATTRWTTDGVSRWTAQGRVLLRVALLWLCGMILDGALLSFDRANISLFNSPLQMIAVAYLGANMVTSLPSRFFRAMVPVLLFLGYALVVQFLGDYTQEGSLASVVERSVLGGIPEKPDPTAPLWVLVTVPYVAIALVGVQCGEVLGGDWPKSKKVMILAVLGGSSLVLGVMLMPFVPSILQLCTVTFALQALGCCLLTLAGCAMLPHSGMWRFAVGWCAFLGQVSLVAYVAGGFFRPALLKGAELMAQGLANLLGKEVQPLVIEFVATLILVAILLLRRNRMAGVEFEEESSSAGNKQSSGNGAIAPRFQIPGIESKVPSTTRSDQPVKSTRTCLKIHRANS